MKEITNRIKELRKQRGLTQLELANALSLQRSALSNYEAEVSSPDIEIATRIAQFFGVSVEYLFGKTDTTRSTVLIPVYGRIAAGVPIGAVEDISGYEEVDTQLTLGQDVICLQVAGHSMEPRICDGDVAIIAVQPEVDNGEIAAVMVGAEEATLKKVNKTEDGIMLIPLNTAFNTMYYTKEEVRSMPITILGKLVELRAKF